MPLNRVRQNFFLLKWLEDRGFSIQKQLFLLQWALPILLALIVVSDEVYEYTFDDAPLWSKVFAIEVCFFGIIGPIAVWFALGWMRAMWLEREQNHKALQQMYDELNIAQERLHILHVQRGELLNRVINVQEEERRHLSREIHDELGQLLTGLSLNLKVCQGTVPANLEQAHSHLHKASNLVQQTIEQARRITIGLRPTALDDAGLLPAIKEELHQRLDPLGLQVSFEAQGDIAHLPPDIAIAAFRIIQEAVTNIIRHAQAHQVKVHLQCTQLGLAAEIADDGIGVQANSAVGKEAKISSKLNMSDGYERVANARHHLGVIGMQERATAIGGWLKVVPGKSIGTEVQLWLPITQVTSENEPLLDEKIYPSPAEVRLNNLNIRQPVLVEVH